MGFVERRKNYRLPYQEKILFTDGRNTLTGMGLNISKGGIFLVTLDPLPLDTLGFVAFMLAHHPTSLCVKAKIAHIVFDRQRAEVECGMGLQFLELTRSHQALIDGQVMNEQTSYLRLREILKEKRPDFSAIAEVVKNLPGLGGLDLSTLRYRVNRICTIFESGQEQSPNESLSA